MVNGFVPWSETKDPQACNTDDPVNFIDVSRDPVRTPFQWSPGKNAGKAINTTLRFFVFSRNYHSIRQFKILRHSLFFMMNGRY